MSVCSFSFFNNSRTANYITEWVSCAKKSHDINIGLIGVHNESPWCGRCSCCCSRHTQFVG